MKVFIKVSIILSFLIVLLGYNQDVSTQQGKIKLSVYNEIINECKQNAFKEIFIKDNIKLLKN